MLDISHPTLHVARRKARVVVCACACMSIVGTFGPRRADAQAPVRLSGDAIDIVAEEEDDEADALRDSSAAVTVVETEKDRVRTADLGEVLARSEGANVRRTGGLGSAA